MSSVHLAQLKCLCLWNRVVLSNSATTKEVVKRGHWRLIVSNLIVSLLQFTCNNCHWITGNASVSHHSFLSDLRTLTTLALLVQRASSNWLFSLVSARADTLSSSHRATCCWHAVHREAWVTHDILCQLFWNLKVILFLTDALKSPQFTSFVPQFRCQTS